MPRRKTTRKTKLQKTIPPSFLREGLTFLIEDEKSAKAFDIFKRVLLEDKKGICFSRSYPPHIQADYQLKGVPIFWLTRRKGEDNYDPVQLNGISHRIQEFMGSEKQTIILLEGIEYLISQNDFKPVLRFIQHIRDEVLVAGSNLLITLSPETLSRNELKLLERELEVFEEKIDP
jgi:hypothetical protein